MLILIAKFKDYFKLKLQTEKHCSCVEKSRSIAYDMRF